MSKRVPQSLITFWQNNPNCHRANCFAISLPTGTTLYVTDGQWDITFTPSTPGWGGPLTTFRAGKYGHWSRGAITSEAGTKLTANTMSLSCAPRPGTTYPGLPLGILGAVHAHLFDGANVWVYAAYMPIGAYGDTSAGIERMFQGTITRVPKLGRNSVEFECADPFYLLSLKVPAKLTQSNCPWMFCDTNCTLNRADFSVTVTAAAGSTQATLAASATLGQPDGYFAQGVAKCLTGANAGLSQTVKSHTGNVLTLTAPWVLPVAAGDTFSVLKGCDKTLQTCKRTAKVSGTVLDNSLNFGGTPFVPAPNQAV